MSARDWADLRAPDFEALAPMRTIAVLPTAAIEQHGPHLPVGTDTYIAEGMLDEVRATCPDDLDLLILPVQAVGKSNEHLWAAGTLTLTAETALRAWGEIGDSLARAGIRKVILVNSHGGNLDLVSILSRELRVKHDMLAVKCQWMSFGAPDGMFGAQEAQFGIHGGDRETSLMLAFRPETVEMGAARDFRSTAEDAPIPPIGPVSLGWVASDLSPDGVVGEAHLATAEKGHALARHQARGFLELARALAEHRLPG
ncbi:creatininase family protein [Jannaschia aquimarina]|uniref:CrnA protein n=1 Tax=Jannaschia aquimarina TaxID=935700 RepID=A0A0D1D472_9RHOB|nr:creatininase family protein [Jannaschia aquimarina]KIT14848.1 Creatinine amidohydrolase [Jannaschia aquimarina]SNS57481.1 creatinine amidohydrolase [Jannaschia aquimarina]